MIIPEKEPDLQVVIDFFLERIRLLSTPGLFQSYSGDEKTWSTRAIASASQQHAVPKEMLVKTTGQLSQILDDCKTLLRKPWDVDITNWRSDLKFEPVPQVNLAYEKVLEFDELLEPAQNSIDDVDYIIWDEDCDSRQHSEPDQEDHKMDSIPPTDIPRLPLAQINLNLDSSQPSLPKARGKRSKESTTIDRGAKKARLTPPRGVTQLTIPPPCMVIEEIEECKDDKIDVLESVEVNPGK